jgi:GNAT superfamily N-acetyltransferase
MKFIPLEENESLLQQAADLYEEVWEKGDNSIKERLLRHYSYPGYKGIAAISEDGKMPGFTYGYTSSEGQYYHGLLSKELKTGEYDKWLKDCFEVVELVVHPSARKKGLASRLMNQLLEGSGHQTAVLTTQVNNSAARNLYKSLGWVVIKEAFYPNGENDPFVIMGNELNK